MPKMFCRNKRIKIDEWTHEKQKPILKYIFFLFETNKFI